MVSAAVEKFFFDRIGDADLVTSPFPHFYVENIFPADFYQELLESLPPDDRYTRQRPPYEARLNLTLTAASVAGLGLFWTVFEDWINSQRLLDKMSAKFSGALGSVHQFRKNLIEKSQRNGRVRISARTVLARDYAHFALGPHTDSAKKFVTAIFYLSRDNRLEQFGTSIYAPKQPGYVEWTSIHHPHADFNLLRTFPNRPNSLFVFMKTENSFHGVEPGDYPNTGRDVMFWLPEIGTGDPTRKELALPRELFEPQDGAV